MTLGFPLGPPSGLVPDFSPFTVSYLFLFVLIPSPDELTALTSVTPSSCPSTQAAGPQLLSAFAQRRRSASHPAQLCTPEPASRAALTLQQQASVRLLAPGPPVPGLPSIILSCLEFSLRRPFLGGRSSFRVDITWAASRWGPETAPGGSGLSSCFF